MNSWIISGAILLVGFFICLILILRSKWKTPKRDIKDYEQGRDKLTYRKKKEEPKQEETSSGWFGLSMIQNFFAAILGIALLSYVIIIVLGSFQAAVSSSADNQTVSIITNVSSGVTEFFLSTGNSFFPAIVAVIIGMIVIGCVIKIVFASSSPF